MKRLGHRAGAWLLLLSVLLAGNLHLPLVQAVAWARMYAHYREGYAPGAALAITFSGKAPCDLCKFVQAAQKEKQQTDEKMTLETRYLLPLPAAAVLVCAPAPAGALRPADAVVTGRLPGRPEPPPPKFA